MDEKEKKFFEEIEQILKTTQQNVRTAVNISMVYTYYEIGKRIVEVEQNVQERAEHGKYILKELSKHLTETVGRGYSVDNLKRIRQFYRIYSSDSIGETLFPQFKNLPFTETGR